MMFVQAPSAFYALRFLLGAAEAGFFPGHHLLPHAMVPARERARAIAGFMTAVVVAGIIGGPMSGALLSLDGVGGLAGWQWLFLARRTARGRPRDRRPARAAERPVGRALADARRAAALTARSAEEARERRSPTACVAP